MDSNYPLLPKQLLQSVHYITIKYVNTQHQKSSSDCALLAIANAVAICNGLSPEYLKYDQNSRRGHLIQTLQNKFCLHFLLAKLTEKMLSEKKNCLFVAAANN